MGENVVDGRPIGVGQFGENVRQRRRTFAIVVGAVEDVDEFRIQLVGEQRLGQLAQIQLQDAGDRMDVDLFQQLFGLVVVCARWTCDAMLMSCEHLGS